MADNFTTPVADGTVVATKDVGGVHYPRNILVDDGGAAAMGLVSAPAGNTLLGLLAAIGANTAGGGGGDASAANQVTEIAALASILAKLSADPATQTTLAAVLAKLNSTLAVTQSGTWNIGAITTLPALPVGANVIGGVTQSGTWNINAITTLPALVAGSAIVGRVGIDQTTDGTTNKVNIDASLKSTTPTRSVVPSGVASVNILASNANRRGATICNQDANALLLDLSGGTAAATRYQKRLAQYESYDVPSGYTGLITGIWEADGTGQADVVEFT